MGELNVSMENCWNDTQKTELLGGELVLLPLPTTNFTYTGPRLNQSLLDKSSSSRPNVAVGDGSVG